MAGIVAGDCFPAYFILLIIAGGVFRLTPVSISTVESVSTNFGSLHQPVETFHIVLSNVDTVDRASLLY